MSRRYRQLTLGSQQKLFKKTVVFGGDLLKNSHAKVKRPLSTKEMIHVVLRSTQARGKRSFLYGNHKTIINDIVRRTAATFGIKVYDYANVGNHLHLMIKINARNMVIGRLYFNKFIRAITGLIARAILRVERGKALGIKFWDQRPFTRVVESWTALKTLKNYILKNKLQAWGLMPFENLWSKEKEIFVRSG